MKIRTLHSMMILGIVSLASLQGAVIIGNVADAVARDTTGPADGIGNTIADNTKVTLRVGTFGDATTTNNFRNAAIFVFELPTLNVGESLDAADFSAHYFSRSGAPLPYNVDLWALRVSATSTLLATDYGAGATPSGPSGQSLLQTDFITSSSATGARYSTNASADTALTTFINNNYVNGGFLFIRANVNNSVTFGSNVNGGTIDQGYELGSGDLTGANLGNRPQLEIAVIPEPSSIALLGIGLASLLLFRRRKP